MIGLPPTEQRRVARADLRARRKADLCKANFDPNISTASTTLSHFGALPVPSSQPQIPIRQVRQSLPAPTTNGRRHKTVIKADVALESIAKSRHLGE